MAGKTEIYFGNDIETRTGQHRSCSSVQSGQNISSDKKEKIEQTFRVRRDYVH